MLHGRYGDDGKGLFVTAFLVRVGVIASVPAGFSDFLGRELEGVQQECLTRGWGLTRTSTPSPGPNSSDGSTAPASSAGGHESSGTSPSSIPSPERSSTSSPKEPRSG